MSQDSQDSPVAVLQFDTPKAQKGPEQQGVSVEKVVVKPGLLDNASMDHVEASDERGTPTTKQKNPDPNTLTKLVSIDGLSPATLSLDDLRTFAGRSGIPKARKMKKVKVCDAIAEHKLAPPPPVVKEENCPRIAVNRKRYCNVIFCDDIRPLLMIRGESLDKDELTDGRKTDEMLHRAICESYNNNLLHNDDAHPHLKGARGHPKTFAGPIKWEKSKETLNSIVKEYEEAFANWKLSGNHGDFEDRIPFCNSTKNNNSLLYLHEFVYQYLG